MCNFYVLHVTKRGKAMPQSKASLEMNSATNATTWFSPRLQRCGQESEQSFYNEPALLKNSHMFDVMQFTKEGYTKKNRFLQYCKKIVYLKEAEHAKSSKDPEERRLKRLALDLLSNEFLPPMNSCPNKRRKNI